MGVSLWVTYLFWEKSSLLAVNSVFIDVILNIRKFHNSSDIIMIFNGVNDIAI